jgi:hypothetical protein
MIFDVGSKFQSTAKLFWAHFVEVGLIDASDHGISNADDFTEMDKVLDIFDLNPHYVPVFLIWPNESQYDKSYWASTDFKDTQVADNRSLLIYFKGTLEDVLEHLDARYSGID